MSDGKGADPPELVERVGYPRWERLILGDDSIGGTLRVLAYILGFVIVFGILFQLVG